MKIHFCALCNESVPQADLDRERAVIRKGRIICFTCEAAMSHDAAGGEQSTPTQGTGEHHTPAMAGADAGARPPAVERGRGGGGFPVFLATLALALSVGGAYYLNQRIQESQRGLGASVEAARRSLDAASFDRERRRDERFFELANSLAVHTERLGDLSERSGNREDALGETLSELRILVGGLGQRLQSLEKVREGIARHDLDIAKMAETVAGLHAELLRLSQRLSEAQAVERQPWIEETPALVADDKPAWWPYVGELASEDSGVRWQAVQSLGDTKDVAVSEYLAPMLGDTDMFVRMATARLLGDLQAVRRIPQLIDALEDPEPSVREAVVISLRGITGQILRFDPNGRDADRAKRIKAWRDWWRRAEKDLVGSES